MFNVVQESRMSNLVCLSESSNLGCPRNESRVTCAADSESVCAGPAVSAPAAGALCLRVAGAVPAARTVTGTVWKPGRRKENPTLATSLAT